MEQEQKEQDKKVCKLAQIATMKKVVETNDKEFRPNYKLIYLYCWGFAPTDRVEIRKALGLSKEVVQQAFTYFKKHKIALPKTLTRKCDQWDVTFPLTPNS